MRKNTLLARFLSGTLVAGLCLGPAMAGTPADSLRSGFSNPPSAARPRVWWYWLNGNITQDGIRKDLEWMSRIGVGGALNFEGSLFTPQLVPRVAYMTPEWKKDFRYAAETAHRLGLEFGIAGSPGFSESGGPWVPPQDGMKKLVWSETVVEGGHPFHGLLSHPPEVTGAYQTVPYNPGLDIVEGLTDFPTPSAYGDTAVIAYRLPNVPGLPTARIHTGDGQNVDPKDLIDPGGPGVDLPLTTSDPKSIIVVEYQTPQTIRSASIFMPEMAMSYFGSFPMRAVLEAQVADGSWKKIADMDAQWVPTTVSFAPTTAQVFRIHFEMVRAQNPPLGATASVRPPGAIIHRSSFKRPTKSFKVSLFQLFSEPRVNRFEVKAGFFVAKYSNLDAEAGPDVPGIVPQSVIDLTDKMDAAGQFNWTPPAGRWRVLRLGWSLEGTLNHPATAEATGLEVDEYDSAAVGRYINHYLDSYAEALGPDLMARHLLQSQNNDSTEIGPSNWTPAILSQFQRLRGYDPRPWLPALTGAIVGSRTQSDAFLYDFRHTLADLVSAEHYGTIAKAVHARGMRQYAEALECCRLELGDDMAMRRYADMPMAALWTYDPAVGPAPASFADLRGASSVAHIYGKNLVAAESMTSDNGAWYYAPFNLKRYIDLEFATGINLPVIPFTVLQPADDKVPGLTLAWYGQHFSRTESWAEMARPWIDYIARNSFLLQQGRNVADVALFYGEDAPLIDLYAPAQPADAPVRYAYDYLNADALLGELKVEGHEIVTSGGARYRLLYLGGTSRHMTLPVLRRVEELASAGAIIAGEAPESSPSLNDNKTEFAALVKRLWGGGAVTQVGRGKIVGSRDVEGVLQSEGISPDFSYMGATPDSQILFVHRRISDGDIYFVNNRKMREERVEAQFRAKGKVPEIWRAETGTSEPVSYRIEGDHTIVPLDLASEDSFFVVFRKPTLAQSATYAKKQLVPIAELSGAWTVVFQPGRGAPPSITLAKLGSLSDQSDPAVKYFSGIATYTKSFTLPKGASPGTPLWLDLGQVGDLAEVSVNGRQAGAVWHAPYQLEIGRLVKQGTNQLEVRVADRWVNRLIGDAQPGAKKVTWTSLDTFKVDAPLLPSGLIGPVVLERHTTH